MNPTTSHHRHRARRVLAICLAGAVALTTASGVANADGRQGRPTTPPVAPIATPAPAVDDLAPPAQSPVPPAGPGALAALSPSGFSLTGVHATPHGTWSRLSYTTNAPAVTIRISDHQPKFVKGVWTEPYMDSIIGPDIVQTTKPGTPMKFDDMYELPATTYYYIITVPTAANQVPVQAVGSFTTLHRTLTISFDTVHVTDDSDKGAKGAGDFTFWLQVNGTQVAHVSKDISSDSTWAIKVDGKPVSVVLPNVLLDDVSFGAQVFEDDIQSWDHCSSELLSGDDWDGVPVIKENSCGTWLAMSDEYDASPGSWAIGYGHQESTPIPFTLTSYQSSVHLTISGTITAVWA